MSGQPELNVERFDALMDAVLEGNAAPKQIELFNALLRHGAAARLRYMAYIDMHATLADPSGALKEPAPEDLPDVMSELIEQALAARRLREIEDEANRKLVVQQADEARNRRYELRRHTQPEPVRRTVVIPQVFVWLSIAAVLAIVATLIFQAANPRSHVAPSGPTIVQPTPPADHAEVNPVATLTESFDAAWLTAKPTFEGDMVPGTYTLTHGWAEVRTLNGVDLVLEAPVTFELGNENTLVLSHGQLVADVPRRAQGFVVSTPSGRVIDLGTTFGVAVDDRGATLAYVLEGEAHITSGRSRDATTLRLVAGEAASVEQDGEVLRSPAVPEQFAREVPATAYQAEVMRSRPMCYWRGPLDESTGLLKDYGWLGADGHGSGVSADPFGFSRDDPSGALDFGDVSTGSISIPFHDQFEFAGAFTIEAWCWIAPGHERFMRVVSTRSERDGVGLGVNAADEYSIETAAPNVPVLSFFGRRDIVGHRAMPEGRWTHLVATVDARGQVRLYINGVVCPHTSVNGSTYQRDSNQTPLMIGRNPFVSSGGGLQSWEGGLDEIAIYDRALTEDEVREHYNALSRP